MIQICKKKLYKNIAENLAPLVGEVIDFIVPSVLALETSLFLKKLAKK
jgi:hypothetical protein